jgi:hypothetical protein
MSGQRHCERSVATQGNVTNACRAALDCRGAARPAMTANYTYRFRSNIQC